MPALPLLLAGALALAAPAAAQPGIGATTPGVEVAAGDGTLYLAAFPSRILVIDEATASVVDEIAVPHGPPRALVVSADRSRFHFVDTTFEHMTTVDVAAREVVDSFTLSEGNRKVRIRSFRVAPDGATAILHVDAAVKLIDRFEVEPYRLLQVDLATHEVLRELPWPTGAASFGSRMLFSPDGEYLYFFDREDILVLEADTFDEVDRWSLREPIEPGMGRMQFGFDDDLLYEEPGFFTNLFTVHDDAQDRDLLGIARIDLPNREVVDFYTHRPAAAHPVRAGPGAAAGLRAVECHRPLRVLDVPPRRAPHRPPATHRGTAPHGARRQHERRGAVHLVRGQHHRLLRRRDVRLPRHADARRRHDVGAHRDAAGALSASTLGRRRPGNPARGASS